MTAKNIEKVFSSVQNYCEHLNLNQEQNISIAFKQKTSNEKHIFHSDQQLNNYHPASLIKLFNAFMAKHFLELNKEKFEAEKVAMEGEDSHIDDVAKAIQAALKDSDNDALSYLVDFNSSTTSGMRLLPYDFGHFARSRESINKFFKNNGYSDNLNIASKCFSFDAYGRDQQLISGSQALGSNSICIEDALKIIQDIDAKYPHLLQFMHREIGNAQDYQSLFIAAGLIEHKDQVKNFYSKAGWTSKVRHDVAKIVLQNDEEYFFAIMTKGLSDRTEIIPSLCSKIFEEIFAN